MAYKHKKSKKDTPQASFVIIIIVFTVLLVLGSFFAIHKYRENKTTNPIASNVNNSTIDRPPTEEELKNVTEGDSAKKKASIESSPEAAAHTVLSNDNVSIRTKKEDNDTVTVLTELHGFSDGTCKLEVRNGTKSTSQNADVIYQTDFSTCAGFSVPVEPLGKGLWTVTLVIDSGGEQFTKQVEVDVK